MKIRKIAGIVCIAFGALNIVDFMAPMPVPTVGLGAFIVGVAFIGLGLFLRLSGGASASQDGARLEWTPKSVQAARDAAHGATDPLLPTRALRLASESKGVLTVSQTAMKLNVTLDEATAALDECALKGAAYISVDDSTGISSYCFPEFMPKD